MCVRDIVQSATRKELRLGFKRTTADSFHILSHDAKATDRILGEPDLEILEQIMDECRIRSQKF